MHAPFGDFWCRLVYGPRGWEEQVTEEQRLTLTIDTQIYEGLLDLTVRRRPRLTKRYVVELALTRLIEQAKAGQLELGLETSDVPRR